MMIYSHSINVLPQYQLITDEAQLAAVCNLVQQKSAVTLDTEFVRVSSYRPKLGLIQLCDGESVWLIDPLTIKDFSPFIALLKNESVLKVLHSCSEDLSVFQEYFQQMPVPMLDTQILARFIGFSASMGLAKLVEHYFQFEIDKGETRTNWLKRPLSEKQLRYATGDVWYLWFLYQKMQALLAETPWQQAVQDDCELALKKVAKNLAKDPNNAYLDIPNAWKLAPYELARLQILAKWRLELAMERDLAMSYIVKSESLWKLAKYAPRNSFEMLELGLTETEVRVRGKKLLQLLAQARKMPEEDYPPKIKRISEDPRYKKAFSLLKEKAMELTPKDLQLETLASKRSFDSLIKWLWVKSEDPQSLPDLLVGWRKTIGLELLRVLKTVQMTDH